MDSRRTRDDDLEDWGDWAEEPAPMAIWWIVTFCGCALGLAYGLFVLAEQPNATEEDAFLWLGASILIGGVLGVVGGLGLDRERRRRR